MARPFVCDWQCIPHVRFVSPFFPFWLPSISRLSTRSTVHEAEDRIEGRIALAMCLRKIVANLWQRPNTETQFSASIPPLFSCFSFFSFLFFFFFAFSPFLFSTYFIRLFGFVAPLFTAIPLFCGLGDHLNSAPYPRQITTKMCWERRILEYPVLLKFYFHFSLNFTLQFESFKILSL